MVNATTVPHAIQQVLEDKGYKVTNVTEDAQFKRIHVENEGTRYCVGSHFRRVEDASGYFGFVVNDSNENDSTWDDLDSIGFDHDSALMGLARQLP